MNDNTLLATVTSTWINLVDAKAEKNRFNDEFMRFAPELRKYILARLKSSVSKGDLPQNKYKVDDFLDDLFIKAFDNFNRFDSAEDYSIWLIQELDQLIEDTSVEEEFNEFFFQDIKKYTHQEWDAMEEKYSVDGGGDFVLLEDFDDPSYRNQLYELRDIFVDNDSEDFINQLSDKLTPEQIHNHIELVFSNLSTDQKTTFQQSVLLGYNVSQIAKIRSTEVSKVEESLKTIRTITQQSFQVRFKNIL